MPPMATVKNAGGWRVWSISKRRHPSSGVCRAWCKVVWSVTSILLAMTAAHCGLVGSMAVLHRHRLALDLTLPSVAQVEKGQTWGCGGGSLLSTDEGLVLPPALPLRMRILSLNAKNYRLGEELTSELLLTNVGKLPLKMPVSIDQTLVFHRDCKWLPAPGVVG